VDINISKRKNGRKKPFDRKKEKCNSFSDFKGTRGRYRIKGENGNHSQKKKKKGGERNPKSQGGKRGKGIEGEIPL